MRPGLRLSKSVACPPGGSATFTVFFASAAPGRRDGVGDVRPRPPQQRRGFLHPRQEFGRRRILVGRQVEAGREDGIVDVVELERLGPQEDLARFPEGQRHVGRVAADARAGERREEGRARAVEELDDLQAEPRRRLPVEVEFDDVLGRRRRMDAVDRAGAFEVGQDEAARLLADERVLAAEPVVVAAGPIVARDEPDPDRALEARQEVEPGHLVDADGGGGGGPRSRRFRPRPRGLAAGDRRGQRPQYQRRDPSVSVHDHPLLFRRRPPVKPNELLTESSHPFDNSAPRPDDDGAKMEAKKQNSTGGLE